MKHFGSLSSKLTGKFLCLAFLFEWLVRNAGPLSCLELAHESRISELYFGHHALRCLFPSLSVDHLGSVTWVTKITINSESCCEFSKHSEEILTILGSATLIKASYKDSNFSHVRPHNTSLAPPVWNTREHSRREIHSKEIIKIIISFCVFGLKWDAGFANGVEPML